MAEQKYEKNVTRPTKPVTFEAPELKEDDDRPLAERLVDQQWRDADAAGLGALHPGSINPEKTKAQKG
jgi:hypothetical protein